MLCTGSWINAQTLRLDEGPLFIERQGEACYAVELQFLPDFMGDVAAVTETPATLAGQD